MRQFLAVLPVAAVVTVFAAVPFSALGRPAPTCGERSHVIDLILTKYQEQRLGMGLAGQSEALGVVELFVSSETGTWTVTVTLPDGRTCLIASGDSWEMRRDEPPARADPT